MRCRRLRHTGDAPIFSATIPISSRRELNAVANRFADARRNPGGAAAAGGFNATADARAHASTDSASDDGGRGHHDGFRVHAIQPQRPYGNPCHLHESGCGHPHGHHGGLFNSGDLAPGRSFSFTFMGRGSFAYHCRIHPSMTATLTVTG
jgi:hypothetical protein